MNKKWNKSCILIRKEYVGYTVNDSEVVSKSNGKEYSYKLRIVGLCLICFVCSHVLLSYEKGTINQEKLLMVSVMLLIRG